MIESITSSAAGLTQNLAKVNGTNPGHAGADFANQMLSVMKDAEVSAIGAIRGEVPMQDVVAKVMEAERTFSAAMAIREKIVGAYLELSRMQI